MKLRTSNKFMAVVASAWLGAGHAATDVPGTEGPALQFTDDDYHILPRAYMFHVSDAVKDEALQYAPTENDMYFGRVGVRQRGESPPALKFAVEERPDLGNYQYCSRKPKCRDVLVRASEKGWLSLAVDPSPGRINKERHFANDFVAQRVTFSAAESDSARKVFREALVKPPATAPDCSEFSDMNADRLTCYMHWELRLPQSIIDERRTTAIMDSLPDKLVQPKANYELVFVEEFDGEYNSTDHGLSNLHSALWNYRPKKGTQHVALDGTPCAEVRDGWYRFSKNRQRGCGHGIGTLGKFNYKYGYIEIKFRYNTVNRSRYYVNYAAAVGLSPGGHFQHHLHGIDLDTLEEELKFDHQEMDIFELIPQSDNTVISHLYFNFDHDALFPAAQPIKFNWRSRVRKSRLYDWEGGGDVKASGDHITQTIGVEWTPAGYRFMQRMDGIESLSGRRLQPGQMQVLRKDWIEIRQRPERQDADGNFAGWHTNEVKISVSKKNQYFTHLDDDDPDSVLIQFAVAHRPQEMGIGVWGPGARDAKDGITTRFEIDYVRVFQPKDRYASMEPVYQ